MTNATKGRKADEGDSGADAPEAKSVQRWNAGRKRDVVLRLLRGESMDAVSRELRLDVAKLESWKAQALGGMEACLRSLAESGLSRELDEALQRLGEVSMENELLRRRCGLARPSTPRRSRP